MERAVRRGGAGGNALPVISSDVMLEHLPGWVVDNETSIRREVAPFVSASDAERIEATRRCCRGAMARLRFHERTEEVLAWTDPIPPTSRAALARLRERYRREGGSSR